MLEFLNQIFTRCSSLAEALSSSFSTRLTVRDVGNKKLREKSCPTSDIINAKSQKQLNSCRKGLLYISNVAALSYAKPSSRIRTVLNLSTSLAL